MGSRVHTYGDTCSLLSGVRQAGRRRGSISVDRRSLRATGRVSTAPRPPTRWRPTQAPH